MSATALASSYPPSGSESAREGPRSAQRTSLLGATFLAAWILIVVDGIWIYFQLKVFGRKALPLSLFVGLFLVAATTWSMAVRGRAIAHAPTALPFWLMTCYLLVAVIVQTDEGWTEVGPAIHGYYVYYFFLLFLPLQWQFPGVVRERAALTVLLALAAGLALLGVAQHFKGDLFDVGRVISAEELAFNLSMHGQTRANALFGHSEDLGHFLALASGLAVGALLAARTLVARAALLLLLTLFAVGCYSCFTRSAYLAFATTVGCAVLLHRSGGNSKLAQWSPLLLFLAGLGLFFGRALLSGLQSVSVLFSSSSIEDRIYMSSHYWQELQRSGGLAVLLGKGWILFSHPRATLPIDNNFLAIALNIGLVGLMLWLWVTWCIWRRCLDRLRRQPSPLRVGLVAAYAPWLMLSVFGVINLYQMIALLVVAAGGNDDE